jgi:murein DD-endopeptidase MepM/ murein hydrolase activator NlpD
MFIPMTMTSTTDDMMLFKINDGYITDAYSLIGQEQGDISEALAKFISVSSDFQKYNDYKDIVKKTTFSESSIEGLKSIFSCVLSGLTGNYEYKTVTEETTTTTLYNKDGSPQLGKDGKPLTTQGKTKVIKWNTNWGVKCRYPIADGYEVAMSDDYGSPRSYGNVKAHEGNDLICDKGTPIINVETGYLRKIHWTDIGGWNMNIESLDGKRHYYYAHLLKFANYTNIGTKIEAGQIIGYVGDSGYGPEGTTGQFIPHLHFQILVNYDGVDKSISIDPYSFLKFLEAYKVKLSDDNGDGVLECDPNSEIRVN